MDTKRTIEKIRQAFENGTVTAVEFCSDGSCVDFNYTDPTGDHGLPCRMASTLKPAEAMEALKGFRLKEHEINKCF
ncbi:hypothetical protein [Prevotella sp. 885]|uniref:hypothetical protein n=1 Tax=Prevotella sp. 885 TaxID=2022527 RepID=UPI000BA12E7B|nr:hypothetical protein [Prevotella sp. 885]OZT04945.1 hypothetical protein CHL74_01795 [Prevotella sp. 885]